MLLQTSRQISALGSAMVLLQHMEMYRGPCPHPTLVTTVCANHTVHLLMTLLTTLIGICMFTEGTGGNKSDCDTITLARARTLLEQLLTKPNVNCETCGRIPIRYPDVQDGGDGQGGILKIDVRSANNCLGSCVGPNSFSTATTTPTPSPSSAAIRLTDTGKLPVLGVFVATGVAWALGVAVFSLL